MGRLFRYISDEVLEKKQLRGECHYCEQTKQLYPLTARSDGKSWWGNGFDPNECCELCYTCIRTIPLKSLRNRDSEDALQGLINSFYKKGALSGQRRQSLLVDLADALRRTPELPLFLQQEDWPYCCGEWCEYLYSPDTYEQSIELGRTMSYWNWGLEPFSETYGDMALEPESLNEVCVFGCLTCQKECFTWQMT